MSIIKDTPEEIYLVIEGVEPGDTFKDCHDVTWEAEQINDNDVKYIRADKLAAQEAQATIAKQATRIAALEADAARYRFLKAQNWHIENFSSLTKADVQWSVSFYSSYGAALNQEDEDRAIDDAMKGGA